MKVLIVTPRYYPNTLGGGERSLHLIAKELNKKIDVEIYSQDGKSHKQSNVDGVVIKRKRLKLKEKTFVNLTCFKNIANKDDYDLLHSYNMDLMPAVGLLTKFFKKNTIATLNGTIFSRNSEWYDLLRHKPTIKQSIFGTLLLMRNTFMMRFIKEIKLYTVLCPYRRDVYVREGLSKERIFVIPNILDLGFKTEEREIEEKIRILYVGNKNWLNGLDILLKAYSQLSKENFELVVVGVKESDAKPYPDAKNPINFLGRIPYKKLPSIYANSDIFVNPFRSPEPVSRTVMEAMQSGIPVIATGTPSYSPIIRDGIDGILVYPCTPNKLVRALETLIEDPGLRRRMGERAKKRVHEICNPERIAKLYLDVYTKTLNVSN